MTASAGKTTFVEDWRVRVAVAAIAVALVLFNPIWTTIRFSGLFGRFLSMQLAYDEPYYFWQLYQQITDGPLDINYRLFGKLLAMILLPLGASFDATMAIYGVINPLLAFGAALVLAATWEKWSLGRVIWALLLLFSFAFLSGSTTLMPGTVILTGTPQGVGMAAKPEPRWLRPGDSVTIEIEKIGALTNPVAFEPV